MFERFFENKRRLAIIAGCSSFGANIASLLSSYNFEVIVLDKDKNAFYKLQDSFSGLTVTADATDTSVLEENSIKKASIFIATTGNDNQNSLLCQIAAKVYDVKNVYAHMQEVLNENILMQNNIHIINPAALCVKEFERQTSLAG